MCRIFSSLVFPFFEELNFAGWLIQFKAHPRRYDADDVLETPIPMDRDANGVPLVERDLTVYKEKHKIALPKS